MVRAPFVDSNGMKKGAWSVEEDDKLRTYIQRYGHWNWRLLPEFAKLKRSGKSCRLRWVNYLKPGVKRGNFNKHEEDLIIELHAKLGNKWSKISSMLPGRTDNEIKNFWHGHIVKKNRTNNNEVEVLEEHKPSETIPVLEEIPKYESMDPLDKHLSSPVMRSSETNNYFSDNSYMVSDFWTDSFLLDVDTYIPTQTDYVSSFQDLEEFMLSDFSYDESNTSNPRVDWNAGYNDHSMFFL